MKTSLIFICLLVLLAQCKNAPAETVAAFRLFSAPQSLHSEEVTLIWDRPEGTGAGQTYEVLRDGKVLETTKKSYLTIKGLEPEHDYVFTVQVQPGPVGGVMESNVLKVRTKPEEAVVTVTDKGAIGDGTTLNTKAIQAAIDACPTGGIVRIPPGIFLSGALFLKSDMTLEIAKDGVLKGSSSVEDYEPFILNRFEGWEMETYASLLNGGKLDHKGPANIRNLSIRGEGKISGGGGKLGDAMQAAKGARSRGRLICILNAENLEVQGLTLENSPCWTMHYVYSENVSLHDLKIRSSVHNGDGIDPDSSNNSFIFNSSFDTKDDCIAIKSGKNPDGNAVNRPTEKVRIFDCQFNGGHGISIGSEMSGGVRDVLVEDCVAGKLLNGLQIKGTKDRGGFVENVIVRDCDLQMITIFSNVSYNNDGEPAPVPPYFRNFRFSNIDLSKADTKKPVIVVTGFSTEGHRTKDVTFENIVLPNGSKVKVDESEDITFKNVATKEGQKPDFEVTNSDRISN